MTIVWGANTTCAASFSQDREGRPNTEPADRDARAREVDWLLSPTTAGECCAGRATECPGLRLDRSRDDVAGPLPSLGSDDLPARGRRSPQQPGRRLSPPRRQEGEREGREPAACTRGRATQR